MPETIIFLHSCFTTLTTHKSIWNSVNTSYRPTQSALLTMYRTVRQRFYCHWVRYCFMFAALLFYGNRQNDGYYNLLEIHLYFIQYGNSCIPQRRLKIKRIKWIIKWNHLSVPDKKINATVKYFGSKTALNKYKDSKDNLMTLIYAS